MAKTLLAICSLRIAGISLALPVAKAAIHWLMRFHPKLLILHPLTPPVPSSQNWAHLDSNQEPRDYETPALPLSYRPVRGKAAFCFAPLAG